MVGGVLLLIATVPKSDLLLDEDGYDDYYDDGSPPYDPRGGSPWQQQGYPQQQTMTGGWQQQQPMPPQPPQQPQQPMLASGMVAGMYGTNAQMQPMQSPASFTQTPQIPQRQRLPAQPPPDPLRKTEPDLLNRERASADSRQLSRTDIGAPARPSVPSPASSPQSAMPSAHDREATNEFATPQPINQMPKVEQPLSPVMTGVINRPSPASKPRAVDQSSQAFIKTMISQDSKTIMPSDLKPEPTINDATEPDRNIAQDMRRADPPPMPPPQSKNTSPIPAPITPTAKLNDNDEVDLMRVSGVIRAPKPVGEEDVDLMRATGNIRRPKPAPALSQAEIDEMDQGKTTRAFGKGPPAVASNDHAAFLLNLMDDEADDSDASTPQSSVADPPMEKETQAFGKPAPSLATDRAAFLLTSADNEDDHATNYRLDEAVATAMSDDDLQTMMPPIEVDDSIPFGVPVLDDDLEQEDGDEHTQYPEPELELEDSQQYGVPMLEEDDDSDPEEENDTDPDLRDAFDEYAAALLKDKDKEDTGPYDVPMLEEEDDDDDDSFQTIISPD
jgi:hypothetical protein